MSDKTKQPKPSCVVLGAGGFIGINLWRRLAADGYQVRGFGRRCEFPDAVKGLDWFQGDFTDRSNLIEAMKNYDVVFHLVHSTTPQAANLNMADDVQRNIVASLAMLEVARELRVGRVVFVSSGGTVYGRTGQIPTPEIASTEPITSYGISKLAIEKYLGLYEYLHKLDHRVLRVANPYGPFQLPTKNQGVIAVLIAGAIKGETVEIWGDGSAVRDFVFIEDVVDALIAAVGDSSGHRIFNIGSGRGRSLNDVIAAIEKCTGQTLKIAWKPARHVDVPISVVDIARAEEALRWLPGTTFERGLEQTIRWWRFGTR